MTPAAKKPDMSFDTPDNTYLRHAPPPRPSERDLRMTRPVKLTVVKRARQFTKYRSYKRRELKKKVTPPPGQLKLCKRMTDSDVEEEEMKQICKKPHPFDYEMDTSSWSRKHEMDTFKSFCQKAEDEQQKEAAEYAKRPDSWKKPKREANAKSYCNACKNPIGTCHNIVYGNFAIDTVREYYHSNLKRSDILIAKKKFVDAYNSAFEWDFYKPTGKMRNMEWTYPPACLKVSSMDLVLRWLEWKLDGEWIRKNDNIPEVFYEW